MNGAITAAAAKVLVHDGEEIAFLRRNGLISASRLMRLSRLKNCAPRR